MTKAGPSGAKTRARKIQQASGEKYTKLRHARSAATQRGHIIQFLTENNGDVKVLPYQIGAAWARQGLRVLMLRDYTAFPRTLTLYSRTAKERRAAEARAQAHPGPRSTVLLEAGHAQCRGLLVEQETVWRAEDEAPGHSGPLLGAIEAGRSHFDIVVVMARGRYPRVHLADHFVLLAHTEDGIPEQESVCRCTASGSAAERVPLTPEQSAAMLRDRHLSFLDCRVPLLGVVVSQTQWTGEPVRWPADGFLRAVAENMAAVGVPLLGHVAVSRSEDLKVFLERQRTPATAAGAPLDPGVAEAARSIRRSLTLP